MKPEKWRKVVVCGTEGCEETFERNSPRHTYCAVCAEARKEGYYDIWYNEKGGNVAKQVYYQTKLKDKLKAEREANLEVEREKNRKHYTEIKDTLAFKRRMAERRHMRRERRKAEAAAGGRKWRERRAPLVEAYLRGEFDEHNEKGQIDE